MIDFDKMIDNHLMKEQRPKKIGRYYPSQIGMCLRKLWYSYKYPVDTEPDLLKVFHLGNILHDFVTEVLRSEKNPGVELLEAECPFKMDIGDFLISGRIDNLMLIKSDGKNILVEVKSIANIDFVKEPNPQYVMQLQLYMYAKNVHNGILLYVDKRNLKSKIFDVPYDEGTAKKTVDRFRFLHNHLTQEKLPFEEAKAEHNMNWMCRYCEYKEKCDRNEK